MALISIHFAPFFSFCNWILLIWNGFYTWSKSKLLFISPLIIGSKLTFSGCCNCWLPTTSIFSHIQLFMVTFLLYVYNIKLTLCAKHVMTAREWFKMVFEKITFQNILMTRETLPLHGNCHFKIHYFNILFSRLDWGEPDMVLI